MPLTLTILNAKRSNATTDFYLFVFYLMALPVTQDYTAGVAN
jgi:hypothetical protein